MNTMTSLIKAQTTGTKMELHELYQMHRLFYIQKPAKLDKISKYSEKTKQTFLLKSVAIHSERRPKSKIHISK